MRRYEVMVILDPDLEEKTIAPSLEAFLNVIRADGGTVHKVDIWGRRRLAYEINHKGDGRDRRDNRNRFNLPGKYFARN